ncbi:MAG: adenylate kinase family protein [Chloroflexota bacterium]
MRIVLIGPQGSGKGTQADRLQDLTGAAHLSSGALVRAEIEVKTDLGRAIQRFNDAGELVPDEVMVKMIIPAIARQSDWVLDGFPRNVAQALALHAALKSLSTPVERAVVLTAPDAILIERLSGRRHSEATGRIYHVDLAPPPPSDPGPFVRRVDDTPEDIRRRLEIYHTETEPLKAYYAERHILTEIDASGPIEQVTSTILRLFN